MKENLKKWKNLFKKSFLEADNTNDVMGINDSLGYRTLGNVISNLMETKCELLEENKRLKQKLKQLVEMEKRKHWAKNFEYFNHRDFLFCDFNKQYAIPTVLNDKVKQFINWYANNANNELASATEMENFIEKVAVWYELRYPNDTVNSILSNSAIYNVMFNNNSYIDTFFDENSDIKYLDWPDFYNTKVFIETLSLREKRLFISPKYNDIVYWNFGHSNAHLCLTDTGIVKEAVEMDSVILNMSNNDFIGKNIKDVVSILYDRNIRLPKKNEFEKAIIDYENCFYKKEEMLNCVMYRIIERDNSGMGAKRAFLFAREFGRNIDIPMAYGVCDDEYFKYFLKSYIRAGGSRNINCYKKYASLAEKLEIVSVGELVNKYISEGFEFYSAKEKKLYQKLSETLLTRIDNDELLKAEKRLKRKKICQLRIDKRLAKTKNF